MMLHAKNLVGLVVCDPCRRKFVQTTVRALPLETDWPAWFARWSNLFEERIIVVDCDVYSRTTACKWLCSAQQSLQSITVSTDVRRVASWVCAADGRTDHRRGGTWLECCWGRRPTALRR